MSAATPIETIVFPGGFNWPLFVGRDLGFFADNGVEPRLTPTPDSKFQMVGLIDGRFDVAMTAVDNVIAYMNGQGAAPTEAEPDLVAFMGCDNGFLRLVAAPDIASIADLRGRTIAVDALTTGYAFALFKALENGGLFAGDYELVSAGGVKARFESLITGGSFSATLLVSPLEAAARRAGCNVLADVSASLAPYQGVVAASRRRWASENPEAIAGFRGGYRAAIAWLRQPANQKEAIAVLMANVPGLTEIVAAESYQILLDPVTGFSADGELDRAGIQTVLDLRAGYVKTAARLASLDTYLA